MRLRRWVALSVLPILWACSQAELAAPGCAEDEGLCPASNLSANAVDCACTCQLPRIPLPGTKQAKYEGTISACLPPSINLDLAAGSQKLALDAMPQRTFNQNVYRFCSETVADWVSLTIKSQAARFEQLPAGLACQPYRCTCETAGARFSEASCQTPCVEETCSKDTCEPILRQGNVLDLSACTCTRTTACGKMAPVSAEPSLCRLPGGMLTLAPDRSDAWHPPMRHELASLSDALPLPRSVANAAGGLLETDRGRDVWRTIDRFE